MKHYRIAQVNIAVMREAPSTPAMASLMGRIEEMNQLAERSQGFIWRLPGSEASIAALQVFDDYVVPFAPERIFFNLSVWASLDDLRHYAFETAHVEMIRQKGNWLEHFDNPRAALWWLPVGSFPTITDSAERLRSLKKSGPTPQAFNFSRIFPEPF